MSNTGLSTAGAIPVKNTKGEISMQKVKVQRYITGRKPKYGDERSPDSDEEEEDFEKNIERRQAATEVGQMLNSFVAIKVEEQEPFSEDVINSDRRLRRLVRNDDSGPSSSRGRRAIQEPEILTLGEERRRPRREEADSSDEEAAEEENVERRHARLRKDEDDEDVLVKEEEGDSDDDDAEDEESEYEEYSDSENETGPRLKPVFVRKNDRITVMEKEKEEQKEEERKIQAKKEADERRKYTLKIIEDEKRREENEAQERDDEMLEASIAAVATDDESEETAYEIWKLRELKRVKRDKDEREAYTKEKLEIERLRGMTEEQRQAELEKNPKLITNKVEKSKYRYLQKYYHRGAFFLDEENEVFTRDIAQPTLEDHFDKTVLPKVMQVKNFGRSGRTKYTHLVDQDTTAFDSPWVDETAQTKKFEQTQAGGSKPVFERPSKKRKT